MGNVNSPLAGTFLSQALYEWRGLTAAVIASAFPGERFLFAWVEREFGPVGLFARAESLSRS